MSETNNSRQHRPESDPELDQIMSKPFLTDEQLDAVLPEFGEEDFDNDIEVMPALEEVWPYESPTIISISLDENFVDESKCNCYWCKEAPHSERRSFKRWLLHLREKWTPLRPLNSNEPAAILMLLSMFSELGVNFSSEFFKRLAENLSSFKLRRIMSKVFQLTQRGDDWNAAICREHKLFGKEFANALYAMETRGVNGSSELTAYLSSVSQILTKRSKRYLFTHVLHINATALTYFVDLGKFIHTNPKFSLLKAVDFIAKISPDKNVRHCFSKMVAELEGGYSFVEALAKTPTLKIDKTLLMLLATAERRGLLTPFLIKFGQDMV